MDHVGRISRPLRLDLQHLMTGKVLSPQDLLLLCSMHLLSPPVRSLPATIGLITAGQTAIFLCADAKRLQSTAKAPVDALPIWHPAKTACKCPMLSYP